MEEIIKSLSYLGGLVRGKPPVLSPTLEKLEVLEYIQQPLKSVSDDFRILLNIGPIKQEELSITVPQQGVVKIAIENSRTQNCAGLWMRRNCTYIVELPAEHRKKELRVEWSDDNYLLIQPVSSGSATKSYPVEIVLIPQRVHRLLKPTIEIPVLRNMLKEIQDKINLAFRYIRFESRKQLIAVNLMNTMPPEGPVSQQDLRSLDEAHHKLVFGDCFQFTSKDDHAESSGNVVDASLTSLREQIGQLSQISAQGKSADSVDEKVRKLIESLDGENGQGSADRTYAEVIVLLMEDRLGQKASPDVETGEVQNESASVAGPSVIKHTSEKREQVSAEQQATGSGDGRRRAQPRQEAFDEISENPSPEKKRRL